MASVASQIHNKRLFLLFPNVSDTTTRLADATSVKIAYSVGDAAKSMTVDDRITIASLTSKVRVAVVTTTLMRGYRRVAKFKFFMPDGTISGLEFISPSTVQGGDLRPRSCRALTSTIRSVTWFRAQGQDD